MTNKTSYVDVKCSTTPSHTDHGLGFGCSGDLVHHWWRRPARCTNGHNPRPQPNPRASGLPNALHQLRPSRGWVTTYGAVHPTEVKEKVEVASACLQCQHRFPRAFVEVLGRWRLLRRHGGGTPRGRVAHVTNLWTGRLHSLRKLGDRASGTQVRDPLGTIDLEWTPRPPNYGQGLRLTTTLPVE